MLVKWFRVSPARHLQSPRVCRLKLHEASTAALCHLLRAERESHALAHLIPALAQQLDTHGTHNPKLPHSGILCSQTRPWHLQLSTSKHPCARTFVNGGGLPNPHVAPFALEAAWLQHLGLILLPPLCPARG